ncbi:winged helix-turn-helix domain-containing protein [Solwaraspora sp. WMMD406]|uniref:winged helix-turn-helix domain-containing protein n=1 Tax=Solwaraspora sp. WMMD406 TaxID=3016095 RepID=UPI0024164F44|nr:winged helix-turn-helix domain-containing protein [Solwaraspora sp. WMMD406]MDG4766280.1 winged helix-turn-helix domain-containing protein [Solwaraspora sp. WMMD406]
MTVSIPIAAGEDALTPTARRLLDAARELVERGEATVTVPGTDHPWPDTVAVEAERGAGRVTSGTDHPRRGATTTATALHVMVASRTVLLDGEPLPLTRLEFDLLLHLVENPRRVFTRLQLLAAVWGYEHTGVRTVDVHIRRLRVKVGETPLITTVYGVGYRLADDVRITIDRAG